MTNYDRLTKKEQEKLDRAIIWLTTEYERALQIDFVDKPIAWALYNTWKHFDNLYNRQENLTESEEKPMIYRDIDEVIDSAE